MPTTKRLLDFRGLRCHADLSASRRLDIPGSTRIVANQKIYFDEFINLRIMIMFDHLDHHHLLGRLAG